MRADELICTFFEICDFNFQNQTVSPLETMNLIYHLFDFIKSEIGWTINFALAHVLFWLYGFPVYQEYGYSSKLGPNGNLPSGPEGSGVVVVTFTLVVSYSLIWAYKLFTHEIGKAADIGLEEKDD